MTLVSGFSFVEAFILPKLATESPAFVAGILGMFSSIPGQVDLGILPRCGIFQAPCISSDPCCSASLRSVPVSLPRWAGALLVLAAVLVPVGAVVPPEFQPKIMLPVGLAMAWLGYALFSERREQVSEPLPVSARPQVIPTAVK